jgi:hypothetical protein
MAVMTRAVKRGLGSDGVETQWAAKAMTAFD